MRSVRAKYGLLLTMLLPTLALATAPDDESPAEMVQLQAWQHEISEQLVERDTADTLTTAAIWQPVSTAIYDNSLTESQRKSAANKLSTKRLQLLDRAAAAAPDAADIAAIALQVCTSAPGCDVAAHAERLHQAAPDDAGYLLPALADAQSRQDTNEVSAILEAMAEAKTFKTWYPALRQRVQRGMGAIAVPEMPAPPPPEIREKHPELDSASAAAMMAGAMMFAVAALPEYGTIVRACKKNGNQFATRQQACRQIGVTLSRDNSLIGSKIGLVLWRRNARDKPDLEAATSAYRAREWQQESWMAFMLRDDVDPIESYQATLENGGEIPGVIALLKKHGISTQPPAGWVSRAELRRQHKQPQADSATSDGVCSGTPQVKPS